MSQGIYGWSIVSGFSWPQRSPGHSHPGLRWAFLTFAWQKGCSFFWGLLSAVLQAQQLWRVGCVPEVRRVIAVSRCAHSCPSPGLPVGWLRACRAIKCYDWPHFCCQCSRPHLPLTCRHNLFCRLSLGKFYLAGFPVPLRVHLGILCHPPGNKYPKRQTSLKYNWEDKSTANNNML